MALAGLVTIKLIVMKTKAYKILKDGYWLADVVISEEGHFFCISDWGNWNFHWGHSGSGDFRKFLAGLGESYFVGKMQQGMAYVSHTIATQAAAKRFAANVLPAIKDVLNADKTEW